MNIITIWLRKNIGLIVSVIGIVLLVILTFGNMGELFTEQYWENVGGNLSSISALTLGLVMIQTTIKQGVSEQALSTGLNRTDTLVKYQEHKNIRKVCRDREIYLPYFLDIRNQRETKRKKREFLIDNNFTTEKALFESKNKKLIRIYKQIQINITADSIKWSTTEISCKKNGQIEKLDVYRKKRAVKGFVTGVIWMLGATLITGGLFLDTNQIPIMQKVVKLVSYFLTIAFSVVFDVCKNYEKGAFGVPNELEEVNSVWEEFRDWVVPDWVVKEVEFNNLPPTHPTCNITNHSVSSSGAILNKVSCDFAKDGVDVFENTYKKTNSHNADKGVNLQNNKIISDLQCENKNISYKFDSNLNKQNDDIKSSLPNDENLNNVSNCEMANHSESEEVVINNDGSVLNCDEMEVSGVGGFSEYDFLENSNCENLEITKSMSVQDDVEVEERYI